VSGRCLCCYVRPSTFFIWNNLCDLVYQTPTKSYQRHIPVAFGIPDHVTYQTPTRHALLGSGSSWKRTFCQFWGYKSRYYIPRWVGRCRVACGGGDACTGECDWFSVEYRRATQDDHLRAGSHQSTDDQHDLPRTGRLVHRQLVHSPDHTENAFRTVRFRRGRLSHVKLPSSLRTDSTDFTTGPFLLSISVLCLFLFLHYSFLFGSVRQTNLATRQLLGAC